MKTDLDLQLALAKMLPEKIHVADGPAVGSKDFFWFNNDVVFVGREENEVMCPVTPSEWLHICWLIEQGLEISIASTYARKLQHDHGELGANHASWQQRAAALIATKGEK